MWMLVLALSRLYLFPPHWQALTFHPCKPSLLSDSTNPSLCRTTLPASCRVLHSNQTPRRQGSALQVWTGHPTAVLHAQALHRWTVFVLPVGASSSAGLGVGGPPRAWQAVGIRPPRAWQASACGPMADGTSESTLGLLLPKTGSPPCNGPALALAPSPQMDPLWWLSQPE